MTAVIVCLLYTSTRHSLSLVAFYSYYTSLRQIQIHNSSFVIPKSQSLKTEVFNKFRTNSFVNLTLANMRPLIVFKLFSAHFTTELLICFIRE